MRRRIEIVVIGLLYEKGRFLMTKRIALGAERRVKQSFDGYWQFPGGGLEFGESPEQTLVREIKEEVGLDIKIEALVPKIFSETRGGWHGVLISYVCSRKDPSQRIRLNEEASEYDWFKLEQIRKLKRLPHSLKMATEAWRLILDKGL